MTGHYIIELLVYVKREKDGWMVGCVCFRAVFYFCAIQERRSRRLEKESVC